MPAWLNIHTKPIIDAHNININTGFKRLCLVMEDDCLPCLGAEHSRKIVIRALNFNVNTTVTCLCLVMVHGLFAMPGCRTFTQHSYSSSKYQLQHMFHTLVPLMMAAGLLAMPGCRTSTQHSCSHSKHQRHQRFYMRVPLSSCANPCVHCRSLTSDASHWSCLPY